MESIIGWVIGFIIFSYALREIVYSAIKKARAEPPPLAFPAAGWIAQFKTPTGKLWRVPLIGWESHGDKLRGVVMMRIADTTPSLVNCEERPDFMGYVYEPGERVHSGDLYKLPDTN